MKNVTRFHVQVLDPDKEIWASCTSQTHLIAHMDDANVFGVILKENEPTVFNFQLLLGRVGPASSIP